MTASTSRSRSSSGPVRPDCRSARGARRGAQPSRSPQRLQRVSGEGTGGAGSGSASVRSSGAAAAAATRADGTRAPVATSTNSSRRTDVPSSTAVAGTGELRGIPAAGASGTSGRASQQGRISSPRSGRRSRSSPQKPTWAATDRRKLRQEAQAVLERRQTQHRAVSAWGVPQCGQRHIGMPGW